MALCKQGLHDLSDPANVYTKPSTGQRECRSCRASRDRSRHVEDRASILAGQAARRELLKRECLDAYGAICHCCGEADARALGLDHLNDDGGQHRRVTGGAGGVRFYRALRQQGYPQDLGLAVACHNCNAGRANNGGVCPHVGPLRTPASSAAVSNRRAKLQMIEAYGGRCACCGESNPAFLTLDHVNGDGGDRRRSLGLAGAAYYRHLRALGWPQEGYQLMCWNCNDAKHGGARCLIEHAKVTA